MVPGLSVFRDWFENYHGRHVIIGGTACNLVYAQYGAPERATKDIDLIVLAEAFDRAYFDRFRRDSRPIVTSGGISIVSVV